MGSAKDVAEKIMALVDEYPSGPLSFERRNILDQLECIVAQHTQQVDDELDESFNLGVDTGERNAREELKDEYESKIEYLEGKLDEAEEDVRRAYDEGFAAGLEVDSNQH